MDGKSIVASILPSLAVVSRGKELIAAIEAAIAQARVEEREAIAKLVADELSLYSCTCCQRVLKSIRARSTP
jgi:hypothetical protein